MNKEGLISYMKRMKLKKTSKRIAVIEMMYNDKKYHTPKDLWNTLFKKFGKLGLPTIYRILQDLEKIKIILPVIIDGTHIHYHICNEPNSNHHHHFICTECHKVHCLNYCDIKKISQKVKNQLGGEITHHSIHLEGICSECLKLKEDKC